MARYYTVAPFAFVLGRPLAHPEHRGKYNALQKSAYASVSVAGVLVTLSGWAIHKTAQLHWLAAAFGGYDAACLALFAYVLLVLFVVPHVVLVLADGWDTMRSMITGRSLRTREQDDLR